MSPQDLQGGLTWKDVAGCEDAKKLLYEALVLPIQVRSRQVWKSMSSKRVNQAPHLFGPRILRPLSTVLLYGPPGTGVRLIV